VLHHVDYFERWKGAAMKDKKNVPLDKSTGKPVTGGNDVQTRVYLDQVNKPYYHRETPAQFLRRTRKR
jgi:hypothetical protein